MKTAIRYDAVQSTILLTNTLLVTVFASAMLASEFIEKSESL